MRYCAKIIGHNAQQRHRAYVCGTEALAPPFGHRLGTAAFGELAALRIEQKAVVAIGRHRQIKHCLQKPVQVGRVKKIVAAHDIRDTLQGVVGDNGKVIACRNVLAAKDHITPDLRLCHQVLPAAAWPQFHEGKAPVDRGEGAGHIEPPAKRRACRHLFSALTGAQQAARAWIVTYAIGIARPVAASGDRTGHVLTRAKTGIKQTAGDKALKDGAVARKMFRLPQHRCRPGDAEPRQILANRRFIFGAAAVAVNILHAQQQDPTASLRPLGIQQGRTDVAQMQAAIRRWRKPENAWL